MEVNKILVGDCLIKLKELEDNSVDSIVTDPPAGISFMGKSWDTDRGGRDNWIKWMSEVATECKRVLKPGGHAFVWTIPRTSHWTATAWENAGFEIRDVVAHIFGSGFPKSLNIGKAVDKLQGNEREVIDNPNTRDRTKHNATTVFTSQEVTGWDKTKGTSEWEGWGTALKPAREDWLLMRKPIEKGLTIAENVLKWGTGGINIDESRVESSEKLARPFNVANNQTFGKYEKFGNPVEPLGRFPANLCWSCDCDNNYLTGNALFDILSNISNQIKLCQSSNSNSNALNVEQKKPQQDTTSEEKKMCFAVENVNTLILEKILGKTLEVMLSVDTGCSVEMLEESMNKSLSISLSGNEKMEEYQKVLKFITLTATNLITELKTCNLSQSQIIGSFITKVISGIREQSRVKSHSQDCWVRECFPDSKSSNAIRHNKKDNFKFFSEGEKKPAVTSFGFSDEGNASRFFKSIIYQAKASKSERNKGCEGLEEKEEVYPGINTFDESGNRLRADGSVIPPLKSKNNHPTVKPIALMEYLIKMVTPKGGIVLDPFSGSFSTGVACIKNSFGFIGIEREEEYVKIGKARMEQAEKEKNKLDNQPKLL